MTIRVFLLDDHEIVRRGVRELLEVEDDIEVVGDDGSSFGTHGVERGFVDEILQLRTGEADG